MDQTELLAIFAALMVVLAIMGIAVDWIGKPLRNRKFIPRIYRYADENMVELDPGRTAFSEAPFMLPSPAPQGVPWVDATGLSDWEQSHFVLPNPEAASETWGALGSANPTLDNRGFAELLDVNTMDTYEQSLVRGETVPMPPPLSLGNDTVNLLPPPPLQPIDDTINLLPPPPLQPIDDTINLLPPPPPVATGDDGAEELLPPPPPDNLLPALDEHNLEDTVEYPGPSPTAEVERDDDLLPAGVRPLDTRENEVVAPHAPTEDAPEDAEAAPERLEGAELLETTDANPDDNPDERESDDEIIADLIPPLAEAAAAVEPPKSLDDIVTVTPKAETPSDAPVPDEAGDAAATAVTHAELVTETPDSALKASTFAALVGTESGVARPQRPVITPERATSEPGVWQAGDPLWTPTAKGTKPSPTLVRRRFWQSAAVLIPGIRWYGMENVTRMADGNPPRRRNRRTGKLESMQLTGLRSSEDRTISRPYWPGNEPDPFELY